MRRMMLTVMCCWILLIVCGDVFAQRPAGPPPGVPQISLGAGGMFSTTPYRGMDHDLIPLPFLFLEWNRFFIRGPGLGLHLYRSDAFSVDLLGRYRMEIYDADDSNYFRGMDDRDGTVEMGLALQWNLGIASLSLEGFSDILDEHGGQQYQLKIDKSFRFNRVFVTPSVGVSTQSQEYSDFAFGVTAREALPDRPEYELGWTVNWHTGVSIRAMINRRVMVILGANVELLDDEISDSPLVDRDILLSLRGGVSYRF